MSADPAKLLEDALAHQGRISLAILLTGLVPVAELRDLAKKHGLTPKGGYRIDKAPAKVLASMFGEAESTTVMEDVCEVLAAQMKTKAPSKKKAAKARPAKTKESHALLELREQELGRVQKDLEKSQANAARQLERLRDLDRQLELERSAVAGLRADLEHLRRSAGQRSTPVEGVSRDQTRQIHELEKEIGELEQAEEQQRRMLAERAAQIKALEERVAEVEALIPKTRLKKKKPMPEPPPVPPAQFRLPHFTPDFFRSLEGKDRRAIEMAYRAIFTYCTEGDSYPGLQVKQLDPPVWSFRAALKLRVYFSRREDGDIDILALADRQEQGTMLRRFRDTY